MKIKQILEGYDLIETLNTKFTNPINWSREGNDLVGYCSIDDIQIKLLIEPLTVDQLNGINVGFSIWDGAEYATTAGAISIDKPAARLVGAVTNAIKSKIMEYDWDFIVLIALDNVDTRAKVYNAIARRICREQQIKYHAFNKIGSAAVIVLSNNHNCQEIASKVDITAVK